MMEGKKGEDELWVLERERLRCASRLLEEEIRLLYLCRRIN